MLQVCFHPESKIVNRRYQTVDDFYFDAMIQEIPDCPLVVRLPEDGNW
jgi:hypothetical protein